APSQVQKIPQHPQSNVTGLLWMKLDTRDLSVLDHRCERLAVLGDRHRVARDRYDVAVREVDLRAVRNAIDDRRLAVDGKAVPTHMRHFHVLRAEAITSAAEDAEARHIGRLVAALEQPLHAEADAEDRTSLADALEDRVLPRAFQRAGRAEMTDARHDDAPRRRELSGARRHDDLGADGGERFLHRREIAGAVVDQGNHSRPFVLGSIRARRLSFAHATRSARANALNTASIRWWLDRP